MLRLLLMLVMAGLSLAVQGVGLMDGGACPWISISAILKIRPAPAPLPNFGTIHFRDAGNRN
ncbi:MAG: hypothetical protein SV765_07555, partial [Pseudomonadota bacterium]|nr:hypothetical protein [Pseudomonadota bacterium]